MSQKKNILTSHSLTDIFLSHNQNSLPVHWHLCPNWLGISLLHLHFTRRFLFWSQIANFLWRGQQHIRTIIVIWDACVLYEYKYKYILGKKFVPPYIIPSFFTTFKLLNSSARLWVSLPKWLMEKKFYSWRLSALPATLLHVSGKVWRWFFSLSSDAANKVFRMIDNRWSYVCLLNGYFYTAFTPYSGCFFCLTR